MMFGKRRNLSVAQGLRAGPKFLEIPIAGLFPPFPICNYRYKIILVISIFNTNLRVSITFRTHIQSLKQYL